jgi:hypothetical protein
MRKMMTTMMITTASMQSPFQVSDAHNDRALSDRAVDERLIQLATSALTTMRRRKVDEKEGCGSLLAAVSVCGDQN